MVTSTVDAPWLYVGSAVASGNFNNGPTLDDVVSCSSRGDGSLDAGAAAGSILPSAALASNVEAVGRSAALQSTSCTVTGATMSQEASPTLVGSASTRLPINPASPGPWPRRAGMGATELLDCADRGVRLEVNSGRYVDPSSNPNGAGDRVPAVGMRGGGCGGSYSRGICSHEKGRGGLGGDAGPQMSGSPPSGDEGDRRGQGLVRNFVFKCSVAHIVVLIEQLLFGCRLHLARAWRTGWVVVGPTTGLCVRGMQR